jgi:hypothetical protein
MCAHRVTDPFDPEPSATPVPQLPWPRRAQREVDEGADASPSASPPPGGERCWRRYRMTPTRAPA